MVRSHIMQYQSGAMAVTARSIGVVVLGFSQDIELCTINPH